ncbi:hypothetical protein [Paenibacillus elgii]|uniref:hypothetical protein n=1 Tax=Paenibacillus elgii TaxID=189691 RepID=UPI001ED9166B|nr:hypothetical protein [Paenibacillus elgii]
MLQRRRKITPLQPGGQVVRAEQQPDEQGPQNEHGRADRRDQRSMSPAEPRPGAKVRRAAGCL